MHDIRLLAKTYQEHNQVDESDSRIVHPAAAVDPRVLLMPTAEARTDRWKILMLSAMVLVGLSTSAIAVRLVMEPSPEPSSPSSKVMEVTPQSPLSTPGVELPNVEAPSPVDATSTSYVLTRSPESSAANPQTHEAVLPPTAKKRKASAKIRTPASTKSESVTKTADTCDEVACLIGVDGTCCGTLPDNRNDAQDAEDELAERPYRLSRSQVMKPLQSVKGRVNTCADKYDYQGVALVKIVITAEGTVGSAELDDGSTEFQSCVEKQVRALRFPKLSQPFTVSYPYTLR